MHSTITEQMVYHALQQVMDPELHHNVVELGFIQEIEIHGDYVHIDIQLTTPHCPFADNIVNNIKQAVSSVKGVNKVDVVRACTKEE